MNLKLKDKLRERFNEHDLIGIYYGKGINFDEYDPEIEQLPLILHEKLSLKGFTDELHKLFQRMFSKELAGNKAKYWKLAKETYDLLKLGKK